MHRRTLWVVGRVKKDLNAKQKTNFLKHIEIRNRTA